MPPWVQDGEDHGGVPSSSMSGWKGKQHKGVSLKQVVPNFGSLDVLGLQLPEILASTASGEGFWEL